MKNKFDITGMNCAACSNRIEKAVLKLNGVKNVSINLLEKTMLVQFNDELLSIQDIIKAVQYAGYGISPHKKENVKACAKEIKTMRNRVIFSFVFALPLFYVSMGEMLNLPFPEILSKNTLIFCLTQIILLIPIISINFKYFKNGYKSLLKMSPDMDSLIAIGATASVLYGLYSFYKIANGIFTNDIETVHLFRHNLYFESAGTILAVVTLGKYLEFRAKENTKSAIVKLMDLSPKTATLSDNNEEKEIKTEDIKVNDILIVKAGETIPVDGVVTEGKCTIDESMLTGESIPILKEISSNVTAGTINKSGYIKVKALKTGENTTLSQIIKLVEDANSSKAPIGRLADFVSSIFVPVVIFLAFLTFIVWLILGKSIDFALTTAISVLVISCPCALGLATPAAIMVASGKGAENGILFKNAEILEKVHSVDTVVFDKTGTITTGKPTVDKIISVKNMSAEEILKYSASVENLSQHPLAQAIVNYAKEHCLEFLSVQGYEQFEGKGIKGAVFEHSYTIGNRSFIKENNIQIDGFESLYIKETQEGKIPIFFCKDNSLEGIIIISDSIKQSSIVAINKLKQMKSDIIMLTGDNKKTAEKIASQAGIETVIAEVLPADKENVIKQIQNKNKTVMMVGDGINDAPALTRADIGIAVSSGSDIAIESADIVLLKNNLTDIINSIKISKATIRNIKQNLFWALFYNSIGIPIAAGCFNFIGLRLNPMIAAFAMGLSSVFVVSNALRLKTLKLEKSDIETRTKKESERKMKKELHIEGMMCMHCANNVQKALSELKETESAEIDLENKKAIITLNQLISDDILKKTVEDLGYELKSVTDAQ